VLPVTWHKCARHLKQMYRLSVKYWQYIVAICQKVKSILLSAFCHVADACRIVCKKACSCLIQSATTSGSRTHPSFSFSTRKTCLSRKSEPLLWRYAFPSTKVIIRSVASATFLDNWTARLVFGIQTYVVTVYGNKSEWSIINLICSRIALKNFVVIQILCDASVCVV